MQQNEGELWILHFVLDLYEEIHLNGFFGFAELCASSIFEIILMKGFGGLELIKGMSSHLCTRNRTQPAIENMREKKNEVPNPTSRRTCSIAHARLIFEANMRTSSHD